MVVLMPNERVFVDAILLMAITSQVIYDTPLVEVYLIIYLNLVMLYDDFSLISKIGSKLLSLVETSSLVRLERTFLIIFKITLVTERVNNNRV